MTDTDTADIALLQHLCGNITAKQAELLMLTIDNGGSITAEMAAYLMMSNVSAVARLANKLSKYIYQSGISRTYWLNKSATRMVQEFQEKRGLSDDH